MLGALPGRDETDGSFFGKYRDNVMFPERLQAAGIRTVTAHAHLYFQKTAAGFDRGFDVYEMVPNLKWNSTTDENITSLQHEKIAEKILGNPAQHVGPILRVVSFPLDPHDQYLRHSGVELYGKKARNLYADGEVTFTDGYIGKLLDLWPRSRGAVAPRSSSPPITARSSASMANIGTHSSSGSRRSRFVDVSSCLGCTETHRCEAEPHRSRTNHPRAHRGSRPMEWKARAWSRKFMGGLLPVGHDIVVDLPRTSDSDRRRAIIHDHYKLIAFGDDVRYEVYDVDADPEESVSLKKTDRAKFDEMVALYKAKRKDIKDVGPYACRTLKGAPVGRAY